MATRSQAFGLDPEQLDHRMNQNNEKNFIFEKNPTPITQQNNSRSTRQITYLESRTKLPVQTVTSGYGSVFVEISGNTVGFYDYNEVEYLLVSSLNQGPAACFKIYLICSVLFVFGWMLSNLEGVLLEMYSAEEEQQMANAMAESAFEAQNQMNQVGAQNCENSSLNGQIPSFQNSNVQNPNFQNPNIQIPNIQNLNSEPINQQNQNINPKCYCAKLATQIGASGFCYHVGSVIPSLLAFSLPITLVLTLQAWAKHNSVNTIRQASSAHNMTLSDPVYIFYLLVSALPMLAFVVTSCSVPCGSVARSIQHNRNNLGFVQRQNEVQRQLVF